MRGHLVTSFVIALTAAPAWADSVEDYFAFNGPATGVMAPAQIDETVIGQIQFVDVRDEAAFVRGHLPGALHLPWAEAIERRDELPSDKKIVLYCETGLQSAQVMLGLRLLGREAAVLLGGYRDWSNNKTNK
ncbi:MAG: rhodanese-like domain-containing protein [Rhodospirillales bacterium]